MSDSQSKPAPLTELEREILIWLADSERIILTECGPDYNACLREYGVPWWTTPCSRAQASDRSKALAELERFGMLQRVNWKAVDARVQGKQYSGQHRTTHLRLLPLGRETVTTLWTEQQNG